MTDQPDEAAATEETPPPPPAPERLLRRSWDDRVIAGVCGPVPAADRAGEAAPAPERRGAVVLGLVFVALGAFFLVDEIWPDFLSWEYIWPLALIGIGLAILLRGKQ